MAVLGFVVNCPVRFRRSDGISGENHPHQDYRQIRTNVHSTQQVQHPTAFSGKSYGNWSRHDPTVALARRCRTSRPTVVTIFQTMRRSLGVIPARTQAVRCGNFSTREQSASPHSHASFSGWSDVSAFQLSKHIRVSIMIRVPLTHRGHPQWMAPVTETGPTVIWKGSSERSPRNPPQPCGRCRFRLAMSGR